MDDMMIRSGKQLIQILKEGALDQSGKGRLVVARSPLDPRGRTYYYMTNGLGVHIANIHASAFKYACDRGLKFARVIERYQDDSPSRCTYVLSSKD